MSYDLELLKDNLVPSQPRHRVLFICPYDWLTSPRSVREVRLLENNNYEPVIVSTKLKYIIRPDSATFDSSPKLNVHFDKVTVYHLPFFLSPLILPKLTFISKVFFVIFYFTSITAYTLWLFVLTLTICLAKGICVMHAHNSPDLPGIVAYLVSKITRIPYIYEVHDLTPELFAERMNLPSDSIIFKLLKKIEYIAISNSAKNIFISKAMQNHFLSNYNLPSSKGVVIYSSWSKNFSSIYKYKDHDLDKLLGEASLDDKFKIIYVGSMHGQRRGLKLLIESMKLLVHVQNLTNIRLIFVGDGELKSNLIRLAEDYGLTRHVLFLGMLPRYEAYKWLKIADVAVNPLRREACMEIGVSNKLLEYMAAGKAVVVSDMAGHREIIRPGYNGLLFDPNDSADLAEKIRFLANDSERIRRLGFNASRDFMEKYCWEREGIKILKLYNEILQNSCINETDEG